MQARYQALQYLPAQLGALPDPVIHFNALNLATDTFDPAQENMTQFQGGVSQRLPFFGKLALREQAAEFQANAAALDLAEMRNQLIRDVKIKWWTLFYLKRAIYIIEINLNLLRQFVEIARSKYEVGEGLQQDVLLAQLELSKLLDQQIQLNSAILATSARLNALLGRPANQKFTISSSVSEQLPNLQAETELYKLAENSRAELASQRQNIQAAKSRLKLAEKQRLPDFNIGVFYSGRDDALNGRKRADFLSFKLSANMPIFSADKQQKAIDQRSSEVMQQRYALQDQHLRVLAEISEAYSDFQQNKQQIILFKQGIIPQARQTVASMLTGYQVNQVDFLNLARSQMTLYNYEIQYWKALTEANQALAKLVASVGQEAIYE